jgi:hypothetical protein
MFAAQDLAALAVSKLAIPASTLRRNRPFRDAAYRTPAGTGKFRACHLSPNKQVPPESLRLVMCVDCKKPPRCAINQIYNPIGTNKL